MSRTKNSDIGSIGNQNHAKRVRRGFENRQQERDFEKSLRRRNDGLKKGTVGY